MSERAQKLAERLRAFNEDIAVFVEGCSDGNWKKACEKEEWPVGVTARHIAAGHFEAVDLARMIVKGEQLPEFTMDQLVAMANAHARQHAACTREEVLGLLRRCPGRREDERPAVHRSGHPQLGGRAFCEHESRRRSVTQAGCNPSALATIPGRCPPFDRASGCNYFEYERLM